MPAITFFKDWIFGQLPFYYKDEDTYKDSTGRGLLERYLGNFGEELDEGFYPFILNFLDLFDAAKCNQELLPHLGFILGIPNVINNDNETYRRILKYAIDLYKVKGTELSYKMLFNLIGISVTLVDDLDSDIPSYDSGFTYDADVAITYDEDCAGCAGFFIAYSSVQDTTVPLYITEVDPTLLQYADNIVCTLKGIDSTFNGYIKKLSFREKIPVQISETSNLSNFEAPTGAFSDDFDTDNSFS
jgi:hypothetical protein